MRGTPTSRGQSFIARDHRYVYLGGSVIALVGLSLWYSAPSPYSFLPAGSVPGTALAAVCYFFLAVSTLALLVKWTHWSSYGETILKRPALVRLSRYLSYLDAAAAALLALDRFVLQARLRRPRRRPRREQPHRHALLHGLHGLQPALALRHRRVDDRSARAGRHGDRVRAGASHGLSPHSGTRQAQQRLL